MDFVTKKEYEAALVTIEKALKNKQLQLINSSSDSKLVFVGVYFYDTYNDAHPANTATLVSGSQAAKDILHSLRKDIKSLKDNSAEQVRHLEELEKKEQSLVAQLPLLKE